MVIKGFPWVNAKSCFTKNPTFLNIKNNSIDLHFMYTYLCQARILLNYHQMISNCEQLCRSFTWRNYLLFKIKRKRALRYISE